MSLLLSLHQVMPFFIMTWLIKVGIHDHNRQNRVLGNLGELLVGIEPRISRSKSHPKPPTTRLHLAPLQVNTRWCPYKLIFDWVVQNTSEMAYYQSS